MGKKWKTRKIIETGKPWEGRRITRACKWRTEGLEIATTQKSNKPRPEVRQSY